MASPFLFFFFPGEECFSTWLEDYLLGQEVDYCWPAAWVMQGVAVYPVAPVETISARSTRVDRLQLLWCIFTLRR